MKKKKKKRSNGHVTVARGMGGEGSVANGHMTVGRWGKGGKDRGREERRGRRGGGGEGERGEEEREGLGRPVNLDPSGPPTLGLSGPSLWANQARHPWARLAHYLGPSGPPSINPVGWPRALKKLKFGPARPEPGRGPNLIGLAHPARPVEDA